MTQSASGAANPKGSVVPDEPTNPTPAKAGEGAEDRKPKASRSKPTKILPTDRIAFQKQLDLLRAYAAASNSGAKAVSNKDVADMMKMADTTASTANSFFSAMGMLTRTDTGFVPSTEVVAFNRAYQWKPETASHQLAPLITGSWFGETLLPKLGFGPMEEEEAIARLAQVAAAGPEYKSQLRLCFDYLEAAGLISRDGSQLRLNRSSGTIETLPVTDAAPVADAAQEVNGRQKPGAVATSFEQASPNAFRFSVDINVDLNELSDWPADRIKALFEGIAIVLTAKSGLEKQTAK